MTEDLTRIILPVWAYGLHHIVRGADVRTNTIHAVVHVTNKTAEATDGTNFARRNFDMDELGFMADAEQDLGDRGICLRFTSSSPAKKMPKPSKQMAMYEPENGEDRARLLILNRTPEGLFSDAARLVTASIVECDYPDLDKVFDGDKKRTTDYSVGVNVPLLAKLSKALGVTVAGLSFLDFEEGGILPSTPIRLWAPGETTIHAVVMPATLSANPNWMDEGQIPLPEPEPEQEAASTEAEPAPFEMFQEVIIIDDDGHEGESGVVNKMELVDGEWVMSVKKEGVRGRPRKLKSNQLRAMPTKAEEAVKEQQQAANEPTPEKPKTKTRKAPKKKVIRHQVGDAVLVRHNDGDFTAKVASVLKNNRYEVEKPGKKGVLAVDGDDVSAVPTDEGHPCPLCGIPGEDTGTVSVDGKVYNCVGCSVEFTAKTTAEELTKDADPVFG